MSSKNPVGEVYARVIKEVCDQSRVDFEEGGVELATLDLLQSEWQKKLSQLKVAQLPWDPTPASSKETALPSNVKQLPPHPLPSNGNPSNLHAGPTLPPIKQEGRPYPQQGQSQQPYTVPSFPQGQPMTAQQRAAMNLHQTYGDRAGAQIAELQQSSQPRVSIAQQIPHPPGYIKQEDSKANISNLSDYHADASTQNSVPIKSSQTDGANEWEQEYARRKEFFAQNHGDSGRLMREHFLSTQQQFEGGGLLLPLDERRIPSISLRRTVMALNSSLPKDDGLTSLNRAQGDATGDEDEIDEEADADAINSDLDDPDELAANEENGENTDQVMLCTFDKVQRVKNKWKCTLKDGVLRVEGNEYVFHKGQGEFEW